MPFQPRNKQMAITDRKRKRSSKPSRAEKSDSAPARSAVNDEDITDPSSGEESADEQEDSVEDVEDELESDDEFEGENPADKRRRLAKQYLSNLQQEANKIVTENVTDERGQPNQEIDDYNNFDAADLEREIIQSRLKQDVAEQEGKVYKFVADHLSLKNAKSTFTRVGQKNLTGLSCYQPMAIDNTFSIEDTNKRQRLYAYTVSKDLQLTKYDITDFNKRPQVMKSVKGGKEFAPTEPLKTEYNNNSEGHYDEILSVAACPNGRYVVTGGRDRKLIVWSTEALAPMKVLPTKDRRGQVMGLAFRKNSDQLYAACADYKVRTYAINQFAQLEILYGHQDHVVDVSALAMERCVTVGAGDKTVMLWKIADESRLTFRGGNEDPDRLKKKWLKNNEGKTEKDCPHFYTENYIDCCSMIDDSHFVTGSDNGSISLWSTSKKKPIFTMRTAHGILPKIKGNQISAETNKEKRNLQLQGQNLTKPYWITSIYAIPYSNVFVSGSFNGSLKLWKLSEDLREFELLKEFTNAKGVITKIQVVTSGPPNKETYRILCTVAKEHRLGRWISNVPKARNGLYSVVIEQNVSKGK